MLGRDRKRPLSLLFLTLLVGPARAAAGGPATTPTAVPIVLGRSVAVLNGPWAFHTGDDGSWAEPGFDDSAWERVDLTPPTGAHDPDVGLKGYVPGWTARGHPGYSGYAWYRVRVSVASPPGDRLALGGPPSVDSAYQLFVNGHLLGGSGAFSDAKPVVYSSQPRMFLLPSSLGTGSDAADGIAVIAFRVWRGPGMGYPPDPGGIHIAPALGEATAIEGRYRLQWLDTVLGYVVDVAVPIAFLMVAITACSLIPFDRSDHAYVWIATSLLLTSLLRLNQALFFWTQSESIWEFDVTRNVILVPVVLGAWTMAWRAWFRLRRPSWVPGAVLALTLLYLVSQALVRSYLAPFVPHRVVEWLQTVSNGIRLLFALLTASIAYQGVRTRAREEWLALLSMALLSVGLFAQELSALHVPGIWFPFGTGVSRTQFAFAAFAVSLFLLLLGRLRAFSWQGRARLAAMVS